MKEIDSGVLGLPYNFSIDNSISLEKELEDLLLLFRLYLKASFKLCTKAASALENMGFQQEDIGKALRYSGNNLPEAVTNFTVIVFSIFSYLEFFFSTIVY